MHEEAERLEHWMSPVVEQRMLAAIGDAKTCPHGHPIRPGERLAGVPLADVEVGGKVRVLRFENEAEELLHLFKREGVEPGDDGVVAESDDEHVVVEFGDVTPRSRARWPRRCPSAPIRRRRSGPRCPSSWCCRRTATG